VLLGDARALRPVTGRPGLEVACGLVIEQPDDDTVISAIREELSASSQASGRRPSRRDLSWEPGAWQCPTRWLNETVPRLRLLRIGDRDPRTTPRPTRRQRAEGDPFRVWTRPLSRATPLNRAPSEANSVGSSVGASQRERRIRRAAARRCGTAPSPLPERPCSA
jgi:hypothetical protein